MGGKKWTLMVLSALLCVFLMWAGLNVLVDPFNAFGDPIFHWDSYTQTLNPRNSKAKYILYRVRLYGLMQFSRSIYNLTYGKKMVERR